MSLRGNEVFLGDAPLSDVDLDAWPLERLQGLFRRIQTLQVEEMERLLPQLPIDALFVSNEEYFARRMWHEDALIFGVKRTVPDEEGGEREEYGYVVVPDDMAPAARALRDAAVRTYRAPAFARFLQQEGAEYEARILADHPDAVVDVTSDLTHWVYFSPEGALLGSLSFPRNGNL